MLLSPGVILCGGIIRAVIDSEYSHAHAIVEGRQMSGGNLAAGNRWWVA